MSLFNLSDIASAGTPEKSPVVGKIKLKVKCASGDKVSAIDAFTKNLGEGEAIYYMTDGAWSNIDLIENLLSITGPADLYFCTWSISTDAIRKFTEWQETGLIKSIHALLDQGIRNRKPELLQQSTAAFKNLKLIPCHAKVCVISNVEYSFVISGSANFTKNPRKESGTIYRSLEVLNANVHWIRKEFGYDY